MKKFAILLFLLSFTGAHAAENKGVPGKNAPVVGWWTREPVCDRIGLTAEQRRTFAADLRNLQVSYQILQTSLSDARARQTAMLLDPATTEAALLAYNRKEVARLTDELQALNFKARLQVRKGLTRVQLETIGKELPGFFAGRWFDSSRREVRQGKVVIEE